MAIKWLVLIDFLFLLRESTTVCGRSLLHSWSDYNGEKSRVIGETGYRTLLIMVLLSFLIGVALMCEIALQLDNYDADIFAVDIRETAVFAEICSFKHRDCCSRSHKYNIYRIN